MIAMLVLNPAIQREFVVRTHMELERRQPGPPAIVHTLGVCAIGFAARLPVSFEKRGLWSENGRKSWA